MMLRALTLGLLVASVVGCYDGYDLDTPNSDRFTFLSPRVAVDGAIDASIPGFVTLEGPATSVEDFSDEGFTEVIVDRRVESGEAMGIVQIMNTDFSHPMFTEIGRTTEVRNGIASVQEGEDPVQVDVMDCGGDAASDWYDQPADEIKVTVEEGPQPQDRLVTLEGTHQDGTAVTTTVLLSR